MKIKNALLSTAAATASLFAIGATAQAATVTVKAGDTVSAIAADHNTTIDAIQQANHLKDVNLILVGQQLEVNGDSTTTTSTSTQTTQQTTTTQSSAQTSQTQAQPSQASQTQSSQTQTSKPAAQTTQTSNSTSNYSNNGSDSAAKAWIAGKESGGSYSARNGQYIGKYQLSASYLNGDYSA
ncbi:LysM peptidoglycan-binding domain-containing protein, partial [Lactiplantibacillus plantarum]